MKLVNKVLDLKSMDMTWSLPNEEGNGNIESSGQVLGLRQKKDCSYGNVVKLQDRGEGFSGCNTTSDSEMWLRTKKDDLGFFLLQNLATGKYLTATTDKRKKLITTGMPWKFIYITISKSTSDYPSGICPVSVLHKNFSLGPCSVLMILYQ